MIYRQSVLVTSLTKKGDLALEQHLTDKLKEPLHYRIEYHALWKEEWKKNPVRLRIIPKWKMQKIMSVLATDDQMDFWKNMTQSILNDLERNGATFMNDFIITLEAL